MDEILRITNLNYRDYNNFNMSIGSEKFVSIIGSNNSGKTTLFKIITGIIPTTEVVTCNDIDLSRQNVNSYIKQLGVVLPCQANSFLFTTVYDEMSYPLKNLGYCDSYIKKRINKVLTLFSLDIKDKKIADLTNYEKMALLFSIALLHQPKLLLIDDIFTYMEDDDAKKIIQVLKSIKKLSIINFSSNLENLSLSNYVYILNKSNIILEGDANDILKEDKLLVKIGLEIPFIVNLCNKLRDENLIVASYDNLEDLVNALWK